MRPRMAMVFTVLGIGAFASSARAQTETITGTVVDLACFMTNKNATGIDHARTVSQGQAGGAACAIQCAKYDGQPVGIVTSEGKAYELTGPIVEGNNAKVIPHLSHIVSVTGTVKVVDGLLMMSTSDLKMISAGK